MTSSSLYVHSYKKRDDGSIDKNKSLIIINCHHTPHSILMVAKDKLLFSLWYKVKSFIEVGIYIPLFIVICERRRAIRVLNFLHILKRFWYHWDKNLSKECQSHTQSTIPSKSELHDVWKETKKRFHWFWATSK